MRCAICPVPALGLTETPSRSVRIQGTGYERETAPVKMGQNRDQIQRLVRCPAEVFMVQYWSTIEDSILEQLRPRLAQGILGR